MIEKRLATRLLWATLPAFTLQALPAAASGEEIGFGPFASVSTSKVYKSKTRYHMEPTNLKFNYGASLGIDLRKWFGLGIDVGMNQLDTTKHASAMTDEFEEIDFAEKLGVNNTGNGDYHYRETQRFALAQLFFRIPLQRSNWLLVGAGARARQRLITIGETGGGEENRYEDKVRVHPLVMIGNQIQISNSFRIALEYRHCVIDPSKVRTVPNEKSESAEEEQSSDADSEENKNNDAAITSDGEKVDFGRGDQELRFTLSLLLWLLTEICG